MAFSFNDQKIGIPCPHCGKKTEKTVAWIKSNSQLGCPGCRNTFTLDKSQFARDIAKAERMVNDFTKRFGR